MRLPEGTPTSKHVGTEPVSRALSKTIRLTATLAALGASLGVNVETILAASPPESSSTQDPAAGLESTRPKNGIPTPAAKQFKIDGAPTPAAKQFKMNVNPRPAPGAEVPVPVLVPKANGKMLLPPRETREEPKAPAPANVNTAPGSAPVK